MHLEMSFRLLDFRPPSVSQYVHTQTDPKLMAEFFSL